MRWLGRILLGLVVVAVLLVLGLLASQIRSPLLLPHRGLLLYVFPLLGLVLVVLGLGLSRGRRIWALLALYGITMAVGVPTLEWRFREQRATVLLETPQNKLERWSRHVVLGYTSFEELREILERMELAGIYLTAHNVAHRSVEEVAHEIRRLQAVQRARGRPPLLVTADQEGGQVTRLSPPLKPIPALGDVARKPDWRGAVKAHARAKARALRRLGVTMNLAPVVDLRLGTERSFDLHSNLEDRAIAAKPGRVAEVAELYSATLWAEGVLPTLKHFPGLGRVVEDTHFFPGRLSATPRTLSRSDWVPFERLGRAEHPVAMMVAHVVVEQIDPKRVASVSEQLVDGVLRRKLGFGKHGIVITDDMCMAPIHYSKGGIAARAVEALAAGVDLLLISFDADQLYPALTSLSTLPKDKVPHKAMARSRRRLKALHQKLTKARAPAKN